MTLKEMDAVASRDTKELFKDVELKSRIKVFPSLTKAMRKILKELKEDGIYESLSKEDREIFNPYC